MAKRTLKTSLASLLAGLLATGCAGTPHSDYVISALSEVSAGAELIGNIIVDEIPQGGSIEYVLSINEGGAYAIYGTCDVDCSDIDLHVHDTDGELMFEDTASDDVPQLDFYADRGGAFRVTIDMVSCQTETCIFGMGLYLLE